MLKKISPITLLILAIHFSAFAQIVEKPGIGNFAITNATIHTITDGTIEDGVLLIEDHKITLVGKNVRIPDTYKVIDGTGKHVYPGFIDSKTRLGLHEISSISLTVDHNEIGDFNPHMLAFTAINPHSASIPVTRVDGITTVLSLPTSGVISGKAVLIDLWGYSPEQMAVKKSAGLHLEWPSTMRGGFWDSRTDQQVQEQYRERMKKLNDFWSKAEFYHRMMTEYENNPEDKIRPDKHLKYEAMREVFRGEIPVVISVDRERDIKNALEWSKEKDNIDFIFAGVSEGWRLADEIAEAGIPVIVNTLYTPTRPYDNYQRPYQNPGLLAEAGVMVVIGTNEVENVRNAHWHAGFAASYGLGREEALKALTINAARMWGVDDRLGSLEPGKQANLIITTGDPFEPATQIEQVFINGYKIPMVSRQNQLYKQFIDRDAVNQ